MNTYSTGDRVTIPTTFAATPTTGTIVEQSRAARHSLVEWDNGTSEWYDTASLHAAGA